MFDHQERSYYIHGDRKSSHLQDQHGQREVVQGQQLRAHIAPVERVSIQAAMLIALVAEVAFPEVPPQQLAERRRLHI